MLRVGDREGEWIVEDVALGGPPNSFVVMSRDGDQQGLLQLFDATDGGKACAQRVQRALGELDHPNIPTLKDHGETRDGCPWVVIEHLDGAPLSMHSQGDPMEVASAAVVFSQAAEALAHIGERGWLHRDLRPDNLWVSGDRLWLMGFEHAMTPSDLLRAEDPTFGSLGYMAPEVMRDYRAHGPSSDLYAIGVSLYECITGQAAFPAAMMAGGDNPSFRAAGWRSREKSLEPGPGVPHWLAALIRRAASPEPMRRFSDPLAVAGWIQAARSEWAPAEDAPGDVVVEAPAMAAPTLAIPRSTLAPAQGRQVAAPASVPAPAAPSVQAVPSPPVESQVGPAPSEGIDGEALLAGIAGSLVGGVFGGVLVLIDLGAF